MPAESNRASTAKDMPAVRKNNKTILLFLIALVSVLMLAVAVIFIVVISKSPEKEYEEQSKATESHLGEPDYDNDDVHGIGSNNRNENDDHPEKEEPELPWTGEVNLRGVDWTDRDDILPHMNEEGYIIFGAYEQDWDSEKVGPDPIEWEVLGSDENGTLLVSRYVLDAKPYNTEMKAVTWENCSLRSWLNNEFMNKAFTEREQARINNTKLKNEDNPYFEYEGGNDTSDRVFLLSLDEVEAYYEFDGRLEASSYSMDLIIYPTRYAQKQGVERETMKQSDITDSNNSSDVVGGLQIVGYTMDCVGEMGAYWWLRTPGNGSDSVSIVSYYGGLGRNYDSSM
ncbi:MAG: DUF6273 domain-containing protein [Lachnospiraceae bacterium]|nr:DUF6273 domain-containing protein [Lachnospiraceae bacterium]